MKTPRRTPSLSRCVRWFASLLVTEMLLVVTWKLSCKPSRKPVSHRRSSCTPDLERPTCCWQINNRRPPLAEYNRIWKPASLIWATSHNLTSLQRQIAKAQTALGQFGPAIQSLDEAIDRSKAIGGHNGILSQLYLQRGYVFEKLKARESAMRAFQDALTVSRNALGNEHVQTAECLEAIAGIEIDTDRGAARRSLTEALDIRTRYARNVLASLSEPEMLRFLEGATRTRDLLLSAGSSDLDAGSDYAAVWNTQELLTRVQLDRRKLAFSDPEAAELWRQIGVARQKVAYSYRKRARQKAQPPRTMNSAAPFSKKNPSSASWQRSQCKPPMRMKSLRSKSCEGRYHQKRRLLSSVSYNR